MGQRGGGGPCVVFERALNLPGVGCVLRGGLLGMPRGAGNFQVQRPRAFCHGRSLRDDAERALASQKRLSVFLGVRSVPGVRRAQTLAYLKNRRQQPSFQYCVGRPGGRRFCERFASSRGQDCREGVGPARTRRPALRSPRASVSFAGAKSL